MTDKAGDSMRNTLRNIISPSNLAYGRLIFWRVVSDVLDAAALSTVLWFFLEIADNWWKLFSVTCAIVGMRRFYLPLWRYAKSPIARRTVDDEIVERFLRVFNTCGYPAPRSADELKSYLLRTMESTSLPEDLRLQAAGLRRELELVEDFRHLEENVTKCESANEAFRRFKATSAKDPYVPNFDEEEAWR